MLCCMRTTLDLDDNLLIAAKKLAAERRVTLTRFVEDALRAAVEAPRTQSKSFVWPTVRGEAPPTVDVADRGALYEALGDAR